MSNFFSEEIAPMIRFRKFPTLAAVLMVGAAMLGAPTPVRASFAIQVYDDGVLGAVSITQISPTLWSFTSTTADFSIGGSASIQLSGNGQLHVSYNDTVTTLTAGTHTLSLLVTDTGYTLPTGTSVLLTSSGGGSYVGATGNSVVGNTLGFLDSSNTPFGNGLGGTVSVANPSGVVSPNAHSTPVSTTGTVTGNTMTEALVYTPPTGSNVVASAIPFSLTNVSYFTFTGGVGDNANISNSLATTPTTATPAPAGLVLVLAGIPCLGVGNWLRRRRQGRLTAV
jgi:hypothetical protein